MLSRRLSFPLFRNALLSAAVAIALLAPGTAIADGKAKGKRNGVGLDSGHARPAFTLARTPEERSSLFEAWKKQHRPAPGSLATKATAAPGGTVQPIVGRAGMVINAAGTVLYTKNFLGGTCDPNIEASTIWAANTAFAAGTAVRPSGSFGSGPNGFHGFNFQSSGGTSGGTEPTWPTTGVGATVTDGTITWTAIAFDPSQFVGCQPMQVISRASGGAETVVAQEGTTLADGSQVAGWSEFMAMNESGIVGFRAALAGYIFNDGEDEGESGIIKAGPGAGAVTRVAATNTTIGGRTVCGFSAMVGINASSQLVFDAYAPFANPAQCDEDNHGIVRFTTGPGNELLVQQGSTIGTPSSTVIGFGQDDDTSGGGSRCVGCEYELIDGFINSAGHVPVVLNLADGTQGVFILTGPGAAIQVARGPAGTIGPRVSINDSDQVVYRATTGGVDHLFRFTPPSTNTIIVSVGDTIGGSPIDTIAPYSDINSAGHVVYGGTTNGGADDAYYFWNGTASTRIFNATESSLASEMLSINDADQVAYVTGMSSGPEDPNGSAEGHETGGVFAWTLAGGSQKLIQLGDVIGGQAVTAVYAEHPSFVGRQWSQAGCLATAYMVLGDDPEFDCTEGGTGFCNPPLQKGGQLFVSCATGVCPVITIAPPTLPAGTQGTPYSQQLVASGGQAPYTFTVTLGTTPPGTNLSAAGLLSGTPTATGTFNFTVTATDANNCTGTKAYSLVIGAPTQVTIALAPPARIVVVGNNSNLTASINIPQSTDTIVTLTSSNPSIATVPATATILANQTSVIFTVNGVAIGGPITVTATLPPSFGATPATSSVTVVAAPAATVPTLSTWALMLLAVVLAAAGYLLSKRI